VIKYSILCFSVSTEKCQLIILLLVLLLERETFAIICITFDCVHDHLPETAGSKPTKDTINGIYESSDVRAGSECTANYDAELSVTATVVEANANNVWFCLAFVPSSTEAITGSHAAAIGFIWSAPEFDGTTVIPTGTAAAPNGTPTTSSAEAATTTATATATAAAAAAAAAATATATATIATSASASAAATTSTTTAISKDARTHRPEIS